MTTATRPQPEMKMSFLKFLALSVLTLACLPLVVVGLVASKGDEPFCLCPWVRI